MEQVVFALVDGEPVGIVDPADAAGDVEQGSLLPGHEGYVLGFKIPRFLQHFTGHVKTLLSVVLVVLKAGIRNPGIPDPSAGFGAYSAAA